MQDFLLILLLQVLLVTQGEGTRGAVKRVLVRSNVEHRYAVTSFVATLRNPRPSPEQLTLTVILPSDAFVSSLTIETGGRNYTTEVTERKRDGRRRPHSEDPHTPRRTRIKQTQRFRTSTWTEPLDTATFYLSYEQLLQRIDGHYTHTLYLLPHSEEARQDVQVTIKESEPINSFNLLQRPDHRYSGHVQEEVLGIGEVRVRYWQGMNHSSDNSIDTTVDTSIIPLSRSSITNTTNNSKDGEGNALSISYDVGRTVDGGEIQLLGRFFVHYFCPEGLPKLPTHTVFALDVSGSMQDFGKLDQLKIAMEAILRGLPPEDSFEVLVFSTRVTSLGVYRARPREVARGVSRIHRLQALGGTNINEALLQAVLGANTHNTTHTAAKQVVFLTDGKPNMGETKTESLRRNVREANIHQLPIFSLAFGQDADLRLLRQVSADNKGFTRTIDDKERPADQLQDFYKQISSPLMTDVDIVYPEDEVDPNSVVRQDITSTYYSGDEVVVAGQLAEGATEVHPIVAGQGKSGPLQFRVSRIGTPEPPTLTADPQRNNYVERLWAYLTVQDLLAVQEIIMDRNLRGEMRARAKEIAIRFKFVTKLTTLNVVNAEDLPEGAPPGLKSAARHQKSNTEEVLASQIHEGLTLLSPSEFAKTLPAPHSAKIKALDSNNNLYGDSDPHFVVQVPGMDLPLCFDIHGTPGDVLSLVRDPQSGIVVNGEVEEAVMREGATYFTKIFISLGSVNFTITPKRIKVDCLDDAGQPTVESVSTSLWPFKKMNPRRRRGRRGKKPRGKKKYHRRSGVRQQRANDQTQHPRRSSRQALSSTPHKTRFLKVLETRLRKRKRNKRRGRVNSTRTRYQQHTSNDQIHPHSLRRFTNPHSQTSLRDRRRSQEPTGIQAHPRRTTNNIHPQAFRNQIHTLTPKKTLHPQDARSRIQRGDGDNNQYQAATTLLRTARHTPYSPIDNPSPLRYPRRYHPQSHNFIHPQSHAFSPPKAPERTMSQPKDTNRAFNTQDSTQTIQPSRDQFQSPSRLMNSATQGESNRQARGEQLVQECKKSLSWKKAAGRRYGQVVVALRNHRKLDLLLGDVEANLLVARTKNKHGQHFLGFYLENHKVLSPNTTGIIGQFAYKTVGRIDAGNNHNNTQPQEKVRLAVIQPDHHRTYQVSEVNAFLSSRFSPLHKTHVTCLHIRQQGRGLVAGTPANYLLPCLTC
ncbi:inter-alpha-trypsin inhibitor heavy chain H5-like [Homarus americanus]|uniref:inter-alpha-trypsin inhibitor heavy chain H5-like n=1 Tax=Homarus americanus TaxID=6706 RepID=UPI001C481172|nr:inter-alpha-trypsin inhibitor heavy chain H5-like [Homarus americanus]